MTLKTSTRQVLAATVFPIVFSVCNYDFTKMVMFYIGGVSAGQVLLAKHHRVLCIYNAARHNRAADHHGADGDVCL